MHELTLVTTDAALPRAMSLGLKQALTKIAKLAHTCRRFEGQFTLLWHNSSLSTRRERRTYEAALDETMS
ncbi:MAG: hypothetical protein OEZ06_31850 [Myxococcales bacterium]|nr:hypothetical protein [Myxococcales bacterium]